MNIQKVLQTLGHKYNSFAMMELASAAGADPFGKVKGLINEAAKEADQKAFCDTEIGKSRKAKDAKSRKMDQYRTRIDEAATTKASLENLVAELSKEVSEIDKSQA